MDAEMQTDDPDLTIPRFFDRAVSLHGDRLFVISGDRELTYRQFRELEFRTASSLARRGVRSGSRVALLLGNTIEHLACWMGIVRLGAIAVSLNARLAIAEIRARLVQVRPVLVVTESTMIPMLTGLAIPTIRATELLETEAGGAPGTVRPGDVAAFISTSGSTGRPKAVMQAHRTYVLTGQSFPFWVGLRPSDRLLLVLPLHHINAQAYSLMGAIGVGASLVLMPRFSASGFWADMRRWNVTQFNAVGAMVSILLSQPSAPNEEDNPVRLCYLALALPEDAHRAFEQRFGLRMTVGYGLSESTFGTVWPQGQSPYGTIGRLRQHPTLGSISSARVVDTGGNDAPSGVVGELLLHSPAIMAGYFEDQAATDQVLRDGWLSTGDLVRRDGAGVFTFVARKKEIIRHKGENIAPMEIENVLMRHPAVREVAAVGVPSSLGEEDIRVAIVLESGRLVTEDDLRIWCEKSLAAFKIPAEFVFLEFLPRTDTHRVAKRLLSRSQPPGQG